MPDLAYITRGGAHPQGKPRVYFCCHPEDQRTFRRSMAKELTALVDCAVWYDPAPDQPLTGAEWAARQADLAQMQLFVLPVTTRLLTRPCPAMEREFPFAVEHHIPVLPVLQEPGLEALFNDRCGNLQFLDPNQHDATALPYADKLKKYLDGVLVGDELAAQVRAAFDAYIFLSYRKKDRMAAQELMRRIHANDFCRDVAIWYDEFLTPGEDFNAAITQALDKSELFVLAVTPHLLERPNYVMTEEFPRARDAGKPILPVEMAPTDRAGLEAAYPGIPPCSTSDFFELHYRLRAVLPKLAARENSNDPRHNYLIGLAYLAGIDVEVDHARAVSLIRGAAEAGLPEAMEKLVAMYRNGEGVARNDAVAAQWQERLVSILEDQWEEQQTEEAFLRYSNALWKLGEQYKCLAALEDVRSVWEEDFQSLVRRGEEYGFPCARRYRMIGCYMLGDLCQMQGDMLTAHRWFSEYMELARALAKKTDTAVTRRDVMIGCGRLGFLCQKEGDRPAARHWLSEYMELARALEQATKTAEAQCDLVIGCTRMGDLCLAERDLPAARRWFEEGMGLARALADEAGTVHARRDLSVSCNRMGDLCQAERDLPAARRWFEEGMELARALVDEAGTVQARRDLSVSFNKMGNLCQAEGDPTAAYDWFKKGMILRCDLLKETGTVQARQDLLFNYNCLGDLCWAKKDLSVARHWFREGLNLARTLKEKIGTADTRSDLALMLYKLGSMSGGDAAYLQEAVEILDCLAREFPQIPGYAKRRDDATRKLILCKVDDTFSQLDGQKRSSHQKR